MLERRSFALCSAHNYSPFRTTWASWHDLIVYGYLHSLPDTIVPSACRGGVPTSRNSHDLFSCSCRAATAPLHSAHNYTPFLTTWAPWHDLILYGYLHSLPDAIVPSACRCGVPMSRNSHELSSCRCRAATTPLRCAHSYSPFLTTWASWHHLIPHGHLCYLPDAIVSSACRCGVPMSRNLRELFSRSCNITNTANRT